MDFLEKFFELVLSDYENIIDLLCDYEELGAVRVYESCWLGDEFGGAGVLEILERCEYFNHNKDNYYYMDRFGYIHGLETEKDVKTFNRRQVEKMDKRRLLDVVIKADYSNYLSDDLIKLLDEYTGKKDGTININELKKGDIFICDNVVYRIIGGESCEKQALSLEKLDIYSLYHFKYKNCYKVD